VKLAGYKKNNHLTPVFICKCKRQIKHRLTFDGGSTGEYQIELCDVCYSNEDKQFLISEEVLHNE